MNNKIKMVIAVVIMVVFFSNAVYSLNYYDKRVVNYLEPILAVWVEHASYQVQLYKKYKSFHAKTADVLERINNSFIKNMGKLKYVKFDANKISNPEVKEMYTKTLDIIIKILEIDKSPLYDKYEKVKEIGLLILQHGFKVSDFYTKYISNKK